MEIANSKWKVQEQVHVKYYYPPLDEKVFDHLKFIFKT